LFSLLALTIIISTSLPAFGYTSGSESRLAGPDRYATAASIAEAGWKQSDYVILVSGENFPDALVAVSLARKYGAPILLSQLNCLPEVTKQMLLDLKAENVILIGGPGVLSDQLCAELHNMGIHTSRLAGQDRYETSIAVAKQFSGISEVAIATGEVFGVALSLSFIAASKNIPVILVPKNSINSVTQAFIKNSKLFKTYVIGNAVIISDNVAQQFANPERISGSTKYDRNISIINRFQSDLDGDKLFLATGNDYADALAGAAYAAKLNSAIVLVSDNLSTATRDYLRSNISEKDVYILGGEGAVSSTVAGSIFNISGISRGYKSVSVRDISNPLVKLGSNEAKYALVFGSVNSPKYQSAAEAEANMVNITIDVWQLNTKGEKYPAKRTLRVNKAIAGPVQSVFKEIFAGREKFPIYSVGGYAWRGDNTSEHNWGLAIDINPNENYMITSGGRIVAGSFWNPANSPYSIPENGDVVNAFHKYGFTWGGNAWRSSNDYMHFSYLGK
jgi:putative cell wall-binding protein